MFTTTIFIPELLKNIISYHKEDPKTIFKCSLVSKNWCDIAIPFLWKNPFRFCYSINQHKIIKIYLRFLSKEFLNEFDLNQIICSEILNPPSYNYLSFLKELIYLTLYESLINLLKNQFKTLSFSEKDDHNDKFCPNFHPSKQFMINKVLPIMNELCKLFLKNGVRINYFNLSAPCFNCKCKWLPLNYITFPSLSKSLSSVQSFTCDNNGCNFNDIIMELSKYSKNILTIGIKKPRKDQNISKWITLINSQKNLQKLKLEYFYSQDSSKISLSIPSQYNSLKEVELIYCKFSQSIILDELSKCSNLTSLKIEDCDFTVSSTTINNDDSGSGNNSPNRTSTCSYFLDDYIELSSTSIINNYFKSLKSLYVSKSQLSQEYFLSFIGQPPSKLEKITLNLIDFFKYPKIIPFIYSNCFQLKVLDILLVEETFERIIPIIKYCKSLEEISIWEKFDWIGHEFYNYYDSFNFMSSDLVIKDISLNLPKNLKKFYFPKIFNFTLENIQNFISNSPNTLKDLRFCSMANDKDYIIDLLEKFAQSNDCKPEIKCESRINFNYYDYDYYKKSNNILFVAKFLK